MRYLVATLAGADALCLVAAAYGATWIHGSLGAPVGQSVLLLSAVMIGTAAVVLPSMGVYNPQNLLAGTREYALVVRGCIYGLAGVSLTSFALQRPMSREWVGVSWALATSLIVAARFLVRRLIRRLRTRGHFIRRTLIVGADANAIALAGQLDSDGTGMKVVGFLDDYHAVGSVLLRDVRLLGRPSALHQIAERTHAGDAIIMPQALPWETLHKLIGAAAVAPNGLRVHVSAGFHDLLTTGVRLSECNHVPLLTINKARLSPKESVVKRSFDYVTALALLIGFAPAACLLVVWQRMHGQRQLLERQRVVGLTGAPFDLLTFRSSAPFASSVIRKVPGLLNVLAGHLSVIGPRPLSTESAPPQLVVRPTIRPGLTGPWAEVEDPTEQSLLDLYYVRSYSLWLDIHVFVWRCLSRLLRRRGAFSRSEWAVGRWQ
jgi:lipopolysaccharide/colanic/teichoic acid biosynthesis glycosyltransferase